MIHSFRSARPFGVLSLAAASLLAAGCASLRPPAAAGASGAAPTAAGTTTPARPPAGPGISASGVPPGSPQAGPPPSSAQPFATVIKDAKKIDGLFTLYQREERAWIELRPEDFGKPFFLSPKLATGIGEARLFGGSMDTPQVIEFRRVHNQVQMIARNTRFIAKAGTPGRARGCGRLLAEPARQRGGRAASRIRPRSRCWSS